MDTLKDTTSLTDVRFVSWLELAWSAMSSRCHELGTRVVVRLTDFQGSKAWWGITLDGRWLRGNNGALTIFDSVSAADRFLRLLKVDRFNIGESCEQDRFVVTQAQEVYTLGSRNSSAQRGRGGNASGPAVFQRLQISQQRLIMGSDVSPSQLSRQKASAPVAA
ncbi:hypothetical protein HUU62_16150 [Rhodoferax sp. 4810]|nr:hypothetical protein [Rhodoferax jenense]